MKKTLTILVMLVCFAFQNKQFANQSEKDLDKSIQELEITDQDKINIYKLLTTLGKTHMPFLLAQKGNLEKIGDKIYHVHSFRFLAFILSDQTLMHSMRQIKKSFFKWRNFAGGFTEKMNKLYSEDEVKKYVKSFAEELNVDEKSIRKYVEQKDWENLLKYLITVKS